MPKTDLQDTEAFMSLRDVVLDLELYQLDSRRHVKMMEAICQNKLCIIYITQKNTRIYQTE